MVHSEADYNAAVEASGILFGNATSEALKKLDEDTLLSVFEGVPQFEVAKSDIEAGIKAVDLFTEKAAIFRQKVRCVSWFRVAAFFEQRKTGCI